MSDDEKDDIKRPNIEISESDFPSLMPEKGKGTGRKGPNFKTEWKISELKEGGSKELSQLRQMFLHLSWKTVSDIYQISGQNFEQAMDALLAKGQKSLPSVKKSERRQSSINDKELMNSMKTLENEAIEEIIKKHTYQEMRERVIGLQQVINIIKRSSRNSNGLLRHNIESSAHQKEVILRRLSKASQQVLFNNATRDDSFSMVDLHGLYLEEAKELLNRLIAYIQQRIQSNRSQCKYTEKCKNGRRCAEFVVMTGRGNHSMNRKSVLQKELPSFFDRKDIPFDKLDDRFIIYIPI